MRLSTERANTLLRKGQDWDMVLATLRTEGFSIIDSIVAYRQITQVPLGEAKHVVHHSDAWSDRRALHDAFHESIWQAVDELTEHDETKLNDESC
jgi:hypothetical protein